MNLQGAAWEVLWHKQYLPHLGAELRAVLPAERKQVLELVKAQACETYQTRRGESPDAQGLMVISTFQVVRSSFAGIFTAATRKSMLPLLMIAADPVATFRNRSVARLFRPVFGKLLQFEEDRRDAGFSLMIPQCGVFDFFKTEAEPQLILMFCAWDRNGLGVLDSSRRPATRRSQTFVTHGRRASSISTRPSPARPPPST